LFGYEDGDFIGSQMSYLRTGKLTLKKLKILGRGGVDMLPPTVFDYAKNPDYSSSKYDSWGYYKSNYSNVPVEYDSGGSMYNFSRGVVASRRIDASSAMDVDAWSLTSIRIPLGGVIKIKYEPQQYSQCVYNDKEIFSIENVQRIGQQEVKVIFKEKRVDLNRFFAINTPVDMRAFIVSKTNAVIVFNTTSDIFSDTCLITQIDAEGITVIAPALNQFLENGRSKIVDGVQRSLEPYFISGAIATNEREVNRYAGGMRVASVSLVNFNADETKVEYLYNKPGTSVSSGVTSFKPYYSVGIHFPTENDFFNDKMQSDHERKRLIGFKTEFQKHLNQLTEKLLLFEREAPAPGVVYEYVTVKKSFNSNYLDNYEVHRFKTFKESMITFTKNDYGSSEKQKRHVKISNSASDIGSLVSQSSYSTNGNLLLSQTRYGYLYGDEDLQFETSLQNLNQGAVEQSFHKYITISDWRWNGYEEDSIRELISTVDKAVVTEIEERANVLTSIEQRNFKTGMTGKTEYHAFDFISGQAIRTVTISNGTDKYLTETVPAYRVVNNGTPVYSSMGIKLRDPSRKHMLVQTAAVYNYKLNNALNPVGLVSASVQTWSNSTPVYDDGTAASNVQLGYIFRKKADYNWVGNPSSQFTSDGLYDITSFQNFDFSNIAANNSAWQKQHNTSLYDVYSHELEGTDLNGNYSATKLAYNNYHVIATASFSKYKELAFSGVEDIHINNLYAGEILKADGLEITRTDDSDSLSVHTGQKSLQLTGSTSRTFKYKFTNEPNTSYRASVWVNSLSGRLYYSINGVISSSPGQPSEKMKSDSWYLVNVDIPKTAAPSEIEVWCSTSGGVTNFDDFRVHPFNASMTSYVYNQWGELTFILNDENMFTEFVYDNVGRLKETKKETFRYGVVKTTSQSYHNQNSNQ
jgi:hypothetical protein